VAHLTPHHCVGLDVGGTKIAGGLVAFPEGRVLARRVVPTGAHRPGGAVLEDALALARDLLASATTLGVSVQGIGIGVAELVDSTGCITSAQTLAWQGMPVAAAFNALAPAVVDADVRVAARGEAVFGEGRTDDPWLYLTVGTGISHCLILRGRPFAGARGNALICGSAALSTVCTVCGAELHPVLEDIAAGPALVTQYNRLSARQAVHGREVLDAAHAGDVVALQVVRSAGTALGVTLAFLINTLDPAAVVVGGGLGLAGGLYWESLVSATRAHIWADAARDLPIVPARLGADAGLVGAATTIWERVRTAPAPADVDKTKDREE
jgi:glucokinase